MKDTLKSPPTEKVTMKKASTMAICITTFFYLCCGGFGYAAFGNSTPGNLLTGFYEPYWLIDFTNACIVVHLIGGYQAPEKAVFLCNDISELSLAGAQKLVEYLEDKLNITVTAFGATTIAAPGIAVEVPAIVGEKTEFDDTLKSPPPEKVTMKKASTMAICITTFFYLCCGRFGYAAFGSSSPGNLLTGFYEPYWLIDFTNACIVLHLIGGYQVFSQPQFAILERWFVQLFPNSGVVNHNHALKLPLLPTLRLNMLRLCLRTAYVASTTGIAIMFPYFNQVVAVAGAFTFWPLVIYFPVEMYFVQANVRPWTAKWVLLRAYKLVCLLLAIFAMVGSIEGLITVRFG
ncbi:hypothetical protein RJ639_015178 [Escallonia herrerae]|uniref:Amino acid transporter transmembrane domain-containing protein n=1 Tax=Escallonia herrerae TaxID=1293975 RepID=A0AA88VLH4_9ASTE|nr:hypothetical protein RJ639_015178 [Escallonia herrerae]